MGASSNRLAAAEPDNPQSWNRYAYVGNTPLQAVDPLGLMTCTWDPYTNTLACPAWHGPGGPGIGGGPGNGGDDGHCIVENRLGPGLADRVNGIATADGPYDPGPYGGDCGHDHSTGGYLPQVGPPVTPNTIDPNPTPPSTTTKPGLLDCASALAGKWSIAGALHAMGVGNNGGAGEAITNALGGNAVSGIVDSVRSFSMSPADLLLGGTHQGLPGTGIEKKGLGGAVTDGILSRFWSAVTGAGQSIQTLNGAASLASTSTTTAEFVSGAGEVKIVWDVASYLTGLVSCVGN